MIVTADAHEQDGEVFVLLRGAGAGTVAWEMLLALPAEWGAMSKSKARSGEPNPPRMQHRHYDEPRELSGTVEDDGRWHLYQGGWRSVSGEEPTPAAARLACDRAAALLVPIGVMLTRGEGRG